MSEELQGASKLAHSKTADAPSGVRQPAGALPSRRAWRQLGLMAICLLVFANLSTIAGWIGGMLSQLEHAESAGNAISLCCAPAPRDAPPREHLIHAVRFFVFESSRVLLLLVLVVFGVGFGRSFVTPERTRRVLLKRGERIGTVLGALLGVVTPFCTCSAVSLFIGFVSAGVPLGVTFAFLVAAPMVNEVALVMLWALVGWKVALLYAGTGLAIAIGSGLVIGAINPRRQVEDWVLEFPTVAGEADTVQGWARRVELGMENVRRIVGKVWFYVLCGIGAGAIIHGWVPENLMAGILGKGTWWGVPMAVVIGVPMYSNAAGIIPIVQALMQKGAALGTSLAFMMAVTALSLPEMIILRKVLKPRLIATFFGIVALGILLVGYLFNWLL